MRKKKAPRMCSRFHCDKRGDPNGVPAGTQRSGSGGERRSKGAGGVFHGVGNGAERTLRRRCADCVERKRDRCRNPCLNDPARCGLEDRRPEA